MVLVAIEASYEDIVSEVKFYIAYMKMIPDIPIPNFKPLPEPIPAPKPNPGDKDDDKDKQEPDKRKDVPEKRMDLKGGWDGWK